MRGLSILSLNPLELGVLRDHLNPFGGGFEEGLTALILGFFIANNESKRHDIYEIYI